MGWAPGAGRGATATVLRVRPPPVSCSPGGAIIRGAFHAPKAVTTKAGDRDLVTATDQAAEKAVLGALRAAFPSHSFIGEEEAAAAGGCPPIGPEPTWCVDPLDGTTNFVHAFPFVCVSVGLLVDHAPTLGVVFNPILDELFVAATGRGATLNGVPIKAREGATELSTSLVGTEIGTSTDPAVLDAMYGRVRSFASAARSLRCGGSCALGLAAVAAGRLDAFFEVGFGGPWDAVAGACIVAEAGGVVGDPAGGPYAAGARRVLAAATPALAAECAAVLAAAPLAAAEPQVPQ